MGPPDMRWGGHVPPVPPPLAASLGLKHGDRQIAPAPLPPAPTPGKYFVICSEESNKTVNRESK